MLHLNFKYKLFHFRRFLNSWIRIYISDITALLFVEIKKIMFLGAGKFR